MINFNNKTTHFKLKSIIPWILGILTSIISTAIMCYIAMETMFGPWIAPCIVIVAGTVLRKYLVSKEHISQNLFLIVTIGAGGGIIATGVGFALPMFYFLDPQGFNAWIANHTSFIISIALLCIAAGSFGIWLGSLFADDLIFKKQLSFPVSQLIFHLIQAQQDLTKEFWVWVGSLTTFFFCFLRDIALFGFSLIPKTFSLLPSFIGINIACEASPLLFSVGFIAGISLVTPLIVGILTRILFITPLKQATQVTQLLSFLQTPTPEAFLTAFCSGLILAEIIGGFIKKKKKSHEFTFSTDNKHNPQPNAAEVKEPHITIQLPSIYRPAFVLETLLVFGLVYAALGFFGFSPLISTMYLGLVAIASFYINLIGGKVGIIPFGRFATFVLIPFLFFLKLPALQLTVICVFFNICAATSSDFLFDLKVSLLGNYSNNTNKHLQLIGLLFASITLGIVLLLLFSQFALGSAELFAQRGQMKAMLIQTFNVNFWVVSLAFLFGILLKNFNISPSMVIGGLIMPVTVSVALALGGLFSLIKSINRKQFYPLFAGIFATESLWILLNIFFKIIKNRFFS